MWVRAVVLVFILILQIASYNRYNDVLQSAYGYSAEKINEDKSSVIAKYKKHDETIIKAPVQINVVMIGDVLSATDEIQKQLLESYKPVTYSNNRTVGVEFVYKYSFIDADASSSKELFSYIDSIAIDSSGEVPVSLIEWLDSKYKEFEVVVDEGDEDDEGEVGEEGDVYYLRCIKTEKECKSNLPYGADPTPICVYNTCGLYGLKYKWIDASLVEAWLQDNVPKVEGYTIFFLKPPSGPMNYLHTYGVTTTDADSGKEFRQESMMGFGGKHRFYFVDLMAGPSFYPDVPIATIAKVFHRNIFDTTSQQDYQKLIVDYINNAIVLLFTPSYLYEPTYKSKYLLDVFVIDQTSGRSFATITQQYLTASKIESAMNTLMPFAEWKFKIEGKSFDWLPRELGRAIVKSMSFDSVSGIDTIRINSETLKTEIDKWAKSSLTPERAKEVEQEGTLSLPVIILVFDAFAYVDDGALGLAMADLADPNVPCCVIVATDKNTLLNFDVGLTAIAVHEVAHLVGLMHPHDGYREDVKGGWFQNWFFDWSSTTMTYASPIGFGCGELIQDDLGQWGFKECGMSLTSFNQFNYDTIDRGLILHLLRQSMTNINQTLAILEAKGYVGELPSSIETALLSIDKDINSVEEEFLKMNYFVRPDSSTDEPPNALEMSLKVLKNSQALIQQADALPPFVQQQGIEQVPAPPLGPKEEKQKPLEEQNSITVNMKLAKKSTLLAIKNAGDTEIYSFEIKASDGNIRFVKAKGWDREKIDANTVIIKTTNKPISTGKSLFVILIVDNKRTGMEWTAFDSKAAILSSGALIPK